MVGTEMYVKIQELKRKGYKKQRAARELILSQHGMDYDQNCRQAGCIKPHLAAANRHCRFRDGRKEVAADSLITSHIRLTECFVSGTAAKWAGI